MRRVLGLALLIGACSSSGNGQGVDAGTIDAAPTGFVACGSSWQGTGAGDPNLCVPECREAVVGSGSGCPETMFTDRDGTVHNGFCPSTFVANGEVGCCAGWQEVGSGGVTQSTVYFAECVGSGG